LGPKESKDNYNEEDLKLLQIVGGQAAISLDNALLYEQTRKFNIILEKEIRKATSKLQLANAELKKLDEAKSTFLSIAAHQLRTPLTAIKGYTSMMLDGDYGKVSNKIRGCLNILVSSSDRLINLIESLLNISRIELGRTQYNFALMQLETVVSSVMQELEMKAKAKNLKLIYDKPKRPLPLIKLDEEKIRQVVMNIIDNAIKYTPTGFVKVSLGKDDKNIIFSVKDSGMGISKDDIPNLFKKFSRAENAFTSHTEGTGLGLYVAKNMMQAHKGKIWVESEGDGKGSEFIFTLPMG